MQHAPIQEIAARLRANDRRQRIVDDMQQAIADERRDLINALGMAEYAERHARTQDDPWRRLFASVEPTPADCTHTDPRDRRDAGLYRHTGGPDAVRMDQCICGAIVEPMTPNSQAGQFQLQRAG